MIGCPSPPECDTPCPLLRNEGHDRHVTIVCCPLYAYDQAMFQRERERERERERRREKIREKCQME